MIYRMKANDDCGLAAAAGDMPKETVNILDRKVQTLGQQVMANKERAITLVADEVFGAGEWCRDKVRGSIYPGGREIYHYDGKQFIELAPVQFESVQDGDSHRITAVQAWKKLETQS